MSPGSQRDILPIAVVIPAHNRPDGVRAAIESVLRQAPRAPAEIHVVDDASTDETADIAAGYPVQVHRLDVNRGAAGARNVGIHAAGQPWVAFLDSDDEWRPNHLDVLWAHHSGHVLVSAGMVVIDPAGITRYLGPVGRDPETIRDPARLVFPENSVAMSAAMVRRDALLEVGAFSEQWRYSEDFDLWLRLLPYGSGLLIPIATVRYNVHEGQKSADRARVWRVQEEIVDAHRAEPWWSPRAAAGRRAAVAWDSFRLGCRSDRSLAIRGALALLHNPVGLVLLPRLLLLRYRRRHFRQVPRGVTPSKR